MDEPIGKEPPAVATKGFPIHQFTGKVFGCDVQYSVVKMDGCLLVWIGLQGDGEFSNLSVSLQSRLNSEIMSTRIHGHLNDTNSQAIGKKLVQKLKKQVFVSYDLKDERWLPEVEKQLFEEIAKVPEAF